MSVHDHLSRLDLWVVALYLAGITALGLYASRRVRDSTTYFIGGRRFGKVLMFAQNLSSGTHADQAAGVMGACYEIGLAGIWYQWMWLLTTPLYWILSPVFRRLRLVTTADFFELRYGRPLAILYSWFALYLTMISIAMIIKAAATTVQAISGFSAVSIMCIVSAAFLSFAFAGGLVAAATTDFVQTLFIAFMSFAAIPFGLRMAGGIKGLSAKLPPQMFTLVGAHEMTWFTVCMLIVVGFVGVVAQPGMMTENASAKTEMNARIGGTYGNFFKRLCTIGWALTGLLGAALYPGLSTVHREEILGIVTVRLLPQGCAGLMIAAILATVMSTCSSFAVSGSALVARNLYIHKERRSDDKFALGLGRVATAVIALGGLALAILMPSVVAGMVRFVTATPFLGVPIWGGIFWRRANRYGAWVSAVGSAIVYYGCGWLGWHFTVCSLVSLIFGIASIILVSLVTPPEPAEVVERLFVSLHRPVDVKKKDSLVADCTSAARSEIDSEDNGERLLLVDLVNLPKTFSWRRYRIDLIGLVLAILFVVVLMLVLLGLSKILRAG
jgi:Na+/proline symporter